MERTVILTAICFVPGVAIGMNIAPELGMGMSCGGMLGGYLIARQETRWWKERICWNGIGLALMMFAVGMLSAFRGRTWTGDSQWEFLTRCSQYLGGVIERTGFRDAHTVSLLKAFLLGDRSGLDGATLETFRKSGASHLLALSGLHMGIIYLILTKMLKPFGGNPLAKRVGGIAIIIATGFFTLMTGASPSCVRAFLFISINETARLSCREIPLLHCLCLALLLQLGLTPWVISQVGFRMSYLAVLGISLFFPFMHSLYPSSGKYDFFAKVWDLAALGISCQMTTAPLSWHLFHTFPRYFLLTNLLAMPVMTVLMTCAILTVLLSVFGIAPQITIQATDFLCSLLVDILKTVSGI